MAKVFYILFTRLYPLAINLTSPFNQKAKLWIKGRKGVFEEMKRSIIPGIPLIWMHCASLGEFEQGRPVFEQLKIKYPSYKILLTFFSPSGYEVRKNYNSADYVFYLPMDSRKNAVRLFEIAKPSLVIYIKYEFWYFYLQEAKKRNIPLLLVSAIFRKDQVFFKSYGSFYRKILSFFTHFFVQDNQSLSLLQSVGFKHNVSVSGDTRFDRVIEIAEQFKPISSIESFCHNAEIIVAGSTWSEDDKELAHYVNKRTDTKFIIAPHSIRKDRIVECLKLYKHSMLFSEINDNKQIASDINTLIVDNVGMLSSLYKYGTVCYIGGGFGADGIHNVLEAAVYGKPVVFGPVYDKYLEAVELIESGGGISIENAVALKAVFDNLLKKDFNYLKICKASLDYVHSKKGSTKKIIEFIQEKRLLTS